MQPQSKSVGSIWFTWKTCSIRGPAWVGGLPLALKLPTEGMLYKDSAF